MQTRIRQWAAISLVSIGTLGCGRESSQPDSTAKSPLTTVENSKYLLTSEPAGAKSVVEARKEGKDNEPIVVVGRIGGSASPWVDKRAAFSIVDRSLKACSDIPGDGCETPWDYCCQTAELPSSTALVKVVDKSGNALGIDARELLQVKELQTVVIRGRAKRDEAGNLTILADGVYVRK